MLFLFRNNTFYEDANAGGAKEMKAKSSKPDFSSILNQLVAQFDESVFLLEKRDYAASTELAIKTANDLSGLIKNLGDDYERAIRAQHFSRLENIKKDLPQMEPAKMEAHLTNYVGMLVELEKYLATSRREIQRNYPAVSFLQQVLKIRRKYWFVALGATACLVLGFWLWSVSYKNKVGLMAEYFSSKDLTNTYKRQIDPKVDFNWGKHSPFPRWRKDNFSVRWSGYLDVPEAGEYEFQTHSDDGVNLWVGDMKIISNWTVHRLVVNKARLRLQKGYIPIRLEYFDAGRTAAIHLMWKKEGDSRLVVIKPKYFVPTRDRFRPGIPLN